MLWLKILAIAICVGIWLPFYKHAFLTLGEWLAFRFADHHARELKFRHALIAVFAIVAAVPWSFVIIVLYIYDELNYRLKFAR